jgi:imidazolonepropionase-like amidohydrolase
MDDFSMDAVLNQKDRNVNGNQMIDVHGGWVLPGFIDAHSHIGLFDDSLDFEGNDGNEETDPITPQLRAIDGIHNADVCFREAYESGVSIVMSGPGSGNVMGGQFALLRTYERTVDRAIIQEPSAQKVAFGENPKRVYGKDDKAPATRMGTAGLLRDTLFKAVEYRDKKDNYLRKKTEYDQAKARHDEDITEMPDAPDFDFQLESLVSVLNADIPLKIHAHRQDDILTAVRICNEFGLTYTLEHCTEGFEIADILAEEYKSGQAKGRGTGNRDQKGGRLLGVIVGPIIGDRSKPELSGLTTKNAGILQKAGLPVAIMTDHPCVPTQYLLLSVGLAVKGGLPEDTALMAITGTAAQICGISDRYGSLTVGKKADFTVFSGDPLDVRSNVCLFVGGGVVRYDPDSLSQSQNDFRASAEPSVSQRVEETTK